MADRTTDQKDHKMSRQEAGKLGGEKTLDERGPEFYSEIGKQQGKENNPGNFANRPKEEVAEAGHKGGVSRGDDQEERQAA